MSAVTTLTPCLLTLVLILSFTKVRVVVYFLQVHSFCVYFSTVPHSLSCAYYMPCLSGPWFGDSDNTLWKEHVINLLMKHFCPVSCYFLSYPRTQLSTPFSERPNLCSFLRARDSVQHPHKTCSVLCVCIEEQCVRFVPEVALRSVNRSEFHKRAWEEVNEW
jgi:hypothetical protein